MIGQKLTNRLTIPVTGISILINIVGPLALNLETANRNPLIKEKTITKERLFVVSTRC